MKGTKLVILLVVLAFFALVAGVAFAGAGGDGGSRDTVVRNIEVNLNGGEVWRGSVSVSGGASGNLNYVWGQLRVSQEILGQIEAAHPGLVNQALTFFGNSVQTLPSNDELLTASVGMSPTFLYYNVNGGASQGQSPATLISHGSQALGLEGQVIGGRTASYSQSISSQNETYQFTKQTEDQDSVMIGDYEFAVQTVVTNLTANVNVTMYNITGYKYVSPIVLDVTGKGKLEASNGQWQPHPNSFTKDKIAMFDFYGNGFEVAMEWVGPNDGLLVEPKADGTIDGSCLFGTSGGYSDGFEKLSMRDTNKDMKISSDELKGLSVWMDKNSNGIADKGEVMTVADLGITQLNLKHTR